MTLLDCPSCSPVIESGAVAGFAGYEKSHCADKHRLVVFSSKGRPRVATRGKKQMAMSSVGKAKPDLDVYFVASLTSAALCQTYLGRREE